MESRIKLFGHPIHQQLIVFPLGLLATALLFDVIHLISDQEQLARAAYYMIAAGILSGLLAAVFGLIDWLGIPKGTRAWQIGVYHMVANVVVLALFTIAWFIRDEPHDPGTTAVVLELIGGGVAVVSGWLGGELVDRLGVGVTPGANLNAPSSLSHGSMDISGERTGISR
jgi:uncharacterized membrane protein